MNGALLHPGQVFSFWHMVGSVTAKKGYREGLTISGGQACSDIGGGLCQMTNLIHWMVLHSPLTVTEHHHHDQLDLFPDYHRQVPRSARAPRCFTITSTTVCATTPAWPFSLWCM